METIRQFMDSLFASLPNTKEVAKAKEHLLEMAEDKYNSLKEEGVSENEAVGQIIAEFGNLDELKDELGIAEEVDNNSKETPTRIINKDEAKDMIQDHTKAAIICGLGVMCFIICVVPTIVVPGDISPVGMFLLIGIGVALQIFQNSLKSKWDFLGKERCALDAEAKEYVENDKKKKDTGIVVAKCIGILLCVICVVPSIALKSNYGAAGLFVFVGLGVFLIVSSTLIKQILDILLGNSQSRTSNNNCTKKKNCVVYDNPNLAAIMDIYWKLVVCLYLSVSFLTHAWGTTWIIFVVAAIVKKCIVETKGREEY